MNKKSKNQKGFTVVEGLLIVLILVVIGTVGYIVYHNDHKTKASVSTTANPYAGWKSYTNLSPVSFKYPSNWTVTTSPGGSDSKIVTVNAPSRSIDGTDYEFGLTFTTYSTSSQYVPTQETVYSSIPLTDSNFTKPLYALMMEIPLLPSQGPNSCEVMDIYGSDTSYSANSVAYSAIPTSTTGMDLNIDGNYTMTTNTAGLSYDQTLGCFSPSKFSSFQEVQQAKKIISSLSE